jgi:hypothetical protein
MLKFLYYIFVNLDSVSMIFLKRAFYRKFKRINKRLIIFDNQDKLFVFFSATKLFYFCIFFVLFRKIFVENSRVAFYVTINYYLFLFYN